MPTAAPFSPKLIRAGLVLIDAETARVLRIISLQYNSDSLTRKLQAQEASGEAGNRVEPTRFKGAAVETITLEADIDATDQLEFPDPNSSGGEFGIALQIALLEWPARPTAAQLQAVDDQASSGTPDIVPTLMPLAVFVWGKNRVVPAKVNDSSITEKAFPPFLNPIHAKLNNSLRRAADPQTGVIAVETAAVEAYVRSRYPGTGSATETIDRQRSGDDCIEVGSVSGSNFFRPPLAGDRHWDAAVFEGPRVMTASEWLCPGQRQAVQPALPPSPIRRGFSRQIADSAREI